MMISNLLSRTDPGSALTADHFPALQRAARMPMIGIELITARAGWGDLEPDQDPQATAVGQPWAPDRAAAGAAGPRRAVAPPHPRRPAPALDPDPGRRARPSVGARPAGAERQLHRAEPGRARAGRGGRARARGGGEQAAGAARGCRLPAGRARGR